MSKDRQETIADIVAEMRHVCHNPTLGVKTNREKTLEKFLKDMLLEYVCRIEAAHKREIADEKRISNAVIQSLSDRKLEMAGEIAAKDSEIAELRECLKEAIREKCPFTRMSCKHGEPFEYECGTDKWRKALEGAKDDTVAKMREALENIAKYAKSAACHT